MSLFEAQSREFQSRHIGPDENEVKEMLETIGVNSLDEEGDFVVRSTPCPFLGSDNLCSIYDVRPSDCARFPYTDERRYIPPPGSYPEEHQFLSHCILRG